MLRASAKSPAPGNGPTSVGHSQRPKRSMPQRFSPTSGLTADGIRRYLHWLGEPTEPATLAPARDPPFFKSRVIRRRLGEPVQAELFDAQ